MIALNNNNNIVNFTKAFQQHSVKNIFKKNLSNKQNIKLGQKY